MNKIKSFHDILKYNDGFTLMEVVVAIVVLAIAILALMSVSVTVIRGNSLNEMMTTATTLAKDQMETLKNTPYLSVSSSPGYPSYLSVTGFPGYQRRWLVNTINVNTTECTGSNTPYTCCTGSGAGTCANRKNVTVDVQWQWQSHSYLSTMNTVIVQ